MVSFVFFAFLGVEAASLPFPPAFFAFLGVGPESLSFFRLSAISPDAFAAAPAGPFDVATAAAGFATFGVGTFVCFLFS